jgi:tripeptide aminopeptidase
MKIDVVQEFLTLVGLNSPSRREAAVAGYLVQRLREMGLSPEVDDSAAKSGSDTGNVICRLPGSAPGPRILLAAHMDTVGPTEGLVPVIRDGVVYSDGRSVLGADDKAGIAMILAALAEAAEGSLPHPPVTAVFTVQEEVGLFGASYLGDLQAELAYVLDGDGPVGSIVHRSPTKMDLDFTVEGRAAHAGVAPETGINAIAVAAAAIARLSFGRHDRETTSNVGIISGGKAKNIVPDRAEVAIEVRSPRPERLEEEVAKILAAFGDAASAAGARLSVRRETPFTAFTVPAAHPVVANAFRAAEALGIAPQLVTSGGGMDANVFNLRGLPCVGLGVGIEDAHAPTEHIALEQLTQGAAFLKALLAASLYR